MQRHPFLDRRLTKHSKEISSASSDCGLVKRIRTGNDEEDILQTFNMILPHSQSHLLSYISSHGSLSFHDLRARNTVLQQKELCGFERGSLTSACIGEDPYTMYLGTLGGYIMVYDIRFNSMVNTMKHIQR